MYGKYKQADSFKQVLLYTMRVPLALSVPASSHDALMFHTLLTMAKRFLMG